MFGWLAIETVKLLQTFITSVWFWLDCMSSENLRVPWRRWWWWWRWRLGFEGTWFAANSTHPKPKAFWGLKDYTFWVGDGIRESMAMMKVFRSCNAELALSSDLVIVVRSHILVPSFYFLNAFGSLFQCSCPRKP